LHGIRFKILDSNSSDSSHLTLRPLSYALHLPASLIIVAVALDIMFGDPAWLPHPVKGIGWLIGLGDRHLSTGRPRTDLINGGVLAIAVIAIACGAASVIISVAQMLNVYAAALAATIVAWTTLALRGLDDAARSVERSLIAGDDQSARCAIRALVGRDPESLDRQGLIRASIESIAENLSDGFVAPLLFLAVAGPIGAIAYKAINTLDSMVGYRDARYLYFGRISARVDDVANLLPSRLTALAIGIAAAIATGRWCQSMRVCLVDGHQHASLNAGYPEAAMAGALGVELGGDAFYAGELEHRPHLGHAELPLDLKALRSARIILWVAGAAAAILILVSRAGILRLVRN
jgi:adenosylcobinamide-phosphate synthase